MTPRVFEAAVNAPPLIEAQRTGPPSDRIGVHISRPASWVLVVVNLLVIIVAAFQKWGYLQILALFWWETVIIGFYNVGRIFVACMCAESLNRWSFFRSTNNRGAVAFILIGFFVVKFGGFALGSGVAILLVPAFLATGKDADALYAVAEGGVTVAQSIAVLVGVMFVSHGISFFRNYLGRREYERTSIPMLLVWPYARLALMVAVMGISLVLLRLFPALARWPLFTGIVLMLKLLADYATHRFEHRPR